MPSYKIPMYGKIQQDEKKIKNEQNNHKETNKHLICPTVEEIQQCIRKGEKTAKEIIEKYIISKYNDKSLFQFQSYINVWPVEALTNADRVDKCIYEWLERKRKKEENEKKEVGCKKYAEKTKNEENEHDNFMPLAGVPISVKDNICMKGKITTAGSKMLIENYTSYDAEVVKKIQENGGIIIGKTNMDEFGMGDSTTFSAFHPSLNPLCVHKNIGGSSGGSAASVMGNEVSASIATDSGGSIRNPAAYTGATAIKPTYGRVSRYGLISYVSSTDTIGVMGKCVFDCAHLLHIIAGYDNKDATSRNVKVPNYPLMLHKFLRSKEFESEEPLKNYRIGILRQGLLDDGISINSNQFKVDEEVKKNILENVEKIQKMKGKIVEISVKNLIDFNVAYFAISNAEAFSNLSRFDGLRYGKRIPAKTLRESVVESRTHGFGQEVQSRIITGAHILRKGYLFSGDVYDMANRTRNFLLFLISEIFKQVDVLILPSTLHTAKYLTHICNNPYDFIHNMIQEDIYMAFASLGGIPALVLPCGISKKDKMPISLQIVANHFNEMHLFKVALCLEKSLNLRRNLNDLLKQHMNLQI